jgi:hypothetical protein
MPATMMREREPYLQSSKESAMALARMPAGLLRQPGKGRRKPDVRQTVPSTHVRRRMDNPFPREIGDSPILPHIIASLR